jgi:hypothetical protein
MPHPEPAPETPTPPPRQHPCRRAIRLARIALLGAVFITLATLTWLRLFGLPNFLRVQLVDELARRGIVANFRSLHFHWFRGFVAQDLRVAWGSTNLPGLEFRIAEADLDVAPPLAWRSRASLLRGFAIRRATLSLPLPLPDEPPLNLQLDDIAAQIRFKPGDAWEIPRLAARLEGLRFELSATLTNVTALRRTQRRATPPPPPDPAARERTLRLARSVVRELATWTDASSARIAVHLHADALNPAASHGDLFIEAPSANTPRGNLTNLRFSTRLQPPTSSNAPSHTTLILELDELLTPSGGFSQLAARAQFTAPSAQTLPTNATWELRVSHAFHPKFRARDLLVSGITHIGETPDPRNATLDSWITGQATRIELNRGATVPTSILAPNLDLHVVASLAQPIPSLAEGTLASAAIDDPEGVLGRAQLRIDLSRTPNPTQPPPDAGPWTPAWPLTGEIEAELTALSSPRLSFNRLRAHIDWNAPNLTLRNLDADLYGGHLLASGSLDILSRLASASASADFDLHGIDPLLGPRSRENFERYQWTAPPRIQAQARVTLPPWNLRNVDWEATVKPTVAVHGSLDVGPGSFKGIPFDAARSSISFDGATWRLPDLKTRRPEGTQEIAVEYNEDTREYRIDARGRVLPPVLKPVLGEQCAEIVDLFEFHEGVDATVSVWGPWTEGTRQAILGSLVATRFTFRGQDFDRLEAGVSYTNRFMVASPVRLTRGPGEATADGVGYDFEDDRLWLTNAINTIEPVVAAAAISPSFPEKLVHYRFANPPRITANGTLRPRDTTSAHLDFTVQGGPFEFWRLAAEHIETDLKWRGNTLTFTNINARFFGGSLQGDAFFDLEVPDDGPYRFDARIRRADLAGLLRHASDTRTNSASGTFDLDLTIDSARTADIHSWNGHGRASLEDGRLWDVPVFGFASPILNAVVPGLGNNRARAAEATFTLTNSLIHTRDLTIDCPPAKLFYRGTLDFDQNVNAKVEAQVLGNFTPMGPLFGLILKPLTKLFEFRTTGTLSDVKVEPLYLPKFLLLPLQPLRLLKGIFGIQDSPHRDTPPHHAQPEIPLPGQPTTAIPTNPPPTLLPPPEDPPNPP